MTPRSAPGASRSGPRGAKTAPGAARSAPGAPQEPPKRPKKGAKKGYHLRFRSRGGSGRPPGAILEPFWLDVGSILERFLERFGGKREAALGAVLAAVLLGLLWFLGSFRVAAARIFPKASPGSSRGASRKPQEIRGNAPGSKRRGGGAQRRREALGACPGSLSRCSCCPARGGSCSSWCFLAVSACIVRCDLRALVSLALLAALASNALPVP